MMRNFIICTALLAIGPLPAGADLAEDMKNLAFGAPVKMVWAQQQAGWTDYHMETADFLLMGFSTEDGRGARVIRDTLDDYGTPFLTHDGERVVYTDHVNDEILIVNWDGTGKRLVKEGVGPCTDVWYDEESGEEYAICGGATRGGGPPVYRFNLDDASDSLLLWDSTECGGVQLSADGTQAIAFIPQWPQIGRLHLPNGDYEIIGGQCLNGMAPDNSYIARLGGPIHRRATLYDSTNTEMFTIDYHEGMRGWEVFHPRWSNQLRFMTRTGPYSAGDTLGFCLSDDCGNFIAEGGTNVEIYFGRFSGDLRTFDDWLQVTDNNKADFGGHSWVDPAPVTPRLNLTPDTLHYYAVPGGDNPAAQTVTAYAWGGLDLSGLTVSDDAGWLASMAASGTDSRRIVNMVSIADSGAGEYVAHVVVTAGTESETLTVLLSIEAGMAMDIGPNPVAFRTYPGGPDPAELMTRITSGKSLSAMSVGNDASWLTTTAQVSEETVVVTNRVSLGGLPGGDYTATVTLTVGSVETTYAVSLVHRQFDLDSGLVAYWAFDDGAGTTLTDSTDGAHHGTVIGAAWTDGYKGGALDFDKDSSDYVSVGTWDPVDNDVTISAWLWWRGPTSGSSQCIIGKVQGWGETAYRWNFQWHKGGYIALNSYYSNGNFQTTIPVTEEWVHLAVTKDDAYAVLYINGDSVGTVYDAEFAGTSGSTVPFTIGAIQTGSGAFDGLIDELRMYDRALPAMEVFRIYDGAPGGDTAAVGTDWAAPVWNGAPEPRISNPVTAGRDVTVAWAFDAGDGITVMDGAGTVRCRMRVTGAAEHVRLDGSVFEPGISFIRIVRGDVAGVRRIIVLPAQ